MAKQIIQGGGTSLLAKVGGIGGLIKGIFTLKGAIPITLVLLLISSFGAILDSFDANTPTPFLEKVGGRILNFEQQMYVDAKYIEENKGIIVDRVGLSGNFIAVWEIIKAIARTLYGFWVLYFIALITYKICGFIVNDEHAMMTCTILTIIFLLIIEIFSNFVIIDKSIGMPEQTLPEKFIPFKGIIASIKVFPMLFHPIYIQTEQVKSDLINENQLLNSTQGVIKDG